MFKLRAAYTHVHQLRAHRLELRLGLLHIGGCGYAAFQAPLSKIELALQVAHR